MNAFNQYVALSPLKKILVGFAFLTLIGLPYQAYETSQLEAKIAAQYAAMTPQDRKATARAQWCRSEPQKCALVQDAEVSIHKAIKK